MGVPENIRAVKRPTNTVVVDTGSNSVLRYAVRERSGTVYVSGGNPQPRNGKTIGHIIDFKFVPVLSATAQNGPAQLCYGNASFVKSVSDDLYTEQHAFLPALPLGTFFFHVPFYGFPVWIGHPLTAFLLSSLPLLEPCC